MDWGKLTTAEKKRMLRWLDTESRIRDGFDTRFAQILRATVNELRRSSGLDYDPKDEPLTKERLAEDQ